MVRLPIEVDSNIWLFIGRSLLSGWNIQNLGSLTRGTSDSAAVVEEIPRMRGYGGEIRGQLGPGSASPLTSFFFLSSFSETDHHLVRGR